MTTSQLDNWTYRNVVFESDDIKDYVAFVYLIENLDNGRLYVGKKQFYTYRMKAVKGKKRKVKHVIESDWKSYVGSSLELQKDISNNAKIKKTILHLCTTKGEASYLELKEQVDRNVLFDDRYYNNFIGCKIHSKHVKSCQKPLDSRLQEVRVQAICHS